IGYSLLDSPVGLAAWMLDHDTDSYYKISRAFVGGEPVGNLTRDNIVDNITLYWLTGTGASAARWYGNLDDSWPQPVRPARLRRRSRFRSASRRSPVRSGLPRAAGSRRSIPTSCTSTRSTGAATSQPGRSRSSSPPSCAPPSDHFGRHVEWKDTIMSQRMNYNAVSPAGMKALGAAHGHEAGSIFDEQERAAVAWAEVVTASATGVCPTARSGRAAAFDEKQPT